MNCSAAQFDRRTARYLKLVTHSAHLDRPVTTVAELYVLDSQLPSSGRVARQVVVEDLSQFRIRITLREVVDAQAHIDLTFTTRDRSQTLPVQIPAERLQGGISLVSHPGTGRSGKQTGQFWFQDLRVKGTRVQSHPERAVGPILSTMYTVDEGVLKLTAQLMPIGSNDPQAASLSTLQRRADGSIVSRQIATAPVIVPGWTATFRVEDWDARSPQEFSVQYGDQSYTGTIAMDPIDQETMTVAGFTGNHMVGHGFERDGYDYATNIWFPHQEIVDAVSFHEPDVLFFSGDQVYEGASPTFPDSDPGHIKLDYLYKWYLWCWSYRDLTKRIPTICMPDDHDVYQGNIWGQGGRQSPGNDHHGGYVHPADFVKMVERTQTSHLPDPYQTEKIGQGIGTYFTDLVWGGVGIAILEDRKFKSGCARDDMPPSGTGRPDHFNDPDFDVSQLDVPGLTLLGEKQLEFLDDFAQDWDDQVMKMAVSQTIFANMATHHGGGLQRLLADLDSNGWPQSGRNRAVDALRKGFVFHLGGDQHLATIVHHGIEEHGDAMWSFCVPSVANFYPRAWAPKLSGEYSVPCPGGLHRPAPGRIRPSGRRVRGNQSRP